MVVVRPISTPDFKPLFQSLRTVFQKNLSTALTEEFQKNARAKGGRSLWKDIADGLKPATTGNAAQVTSLHPAASIRQWGGIIRAKNKPWLTIPTGSEAKGKTASQMRGQGWLIFRIPGKDGGYLLGTRGKGGKAVLLFTLRKQVQHPADPWMPNDQQIFRTIDSVFMKTEV